MKRKSTLSLLSLFIIPSLTGFCATHTIVNSGFTFSPDSITANVGDSVIFTLASFHSAIEVDQSVWNVNGSTSNGGFSTPLGGGTVVVSQAKTYYYVCGVHFSSGMKGMIVVSNSSGIKSPGTNSEDLVLSPNPAEDKFTVHTGQASGKENRIKLFTVNGVIAFERKNISSDEVIDLAQIAPGVYFLALYIDNGIRVKKLVITR